MMPLTLGQTCIKVGKKFVIYLDPQILKFFQTVIFWLILMSYSFFKIKTESRCSGEGLWSGDLSFILNSILHIQLKLK